jgi:cysteinyl-tRNA synthetase
MSIRIYNSLTRTTEPLETIDPGIVKMYVCGVTVYDKAHIGHAMSAMVFDVIRRYLEFRGYHVQHVVNFTDVDDKIINRANALGIDPKVLAAELAQEFLDDLQKLSVKPASVYPRVTETMPEILGFISDLITKGHAYAAEQGVYFRVPSDPDYGRLSRRSLDDMVAGNRISLDEQKEHPADFALWKAAKQGEPFWESPWGHGRPGWHIECSAMNLKHLGEQIDIHGGGSDLVFPHHENEIAQTESLTGKPFARYWMHNGMLQIQTKLADGTTKMEKMSKSLGNVVTIETFLADNEANVLRLIVLSSYYRSPLAYGEEILADQKRKLARLRSALEPANGTLESGAAVEQLHATVTAAREHFIEAMDSDFNTSGAMAALFEIVRAVNIARDAGIGPQALMHGQAELGELASVLGLTLEREQSQSQAAAPFIDLLVSLRTELRQAKQYALADSLRQRLADLGIIIEDTPQGTKWKQK